MNTPKKTPKKYDAPNLQINTSKSTNTQEKIRDKILMLVGVGIIGTIVATNVDFSKFSPFDDADKSSEVEKQPKLKLKSWELSGNTIRSRAQIYAHGKKNQTFLIDTYGNLIGGAHTLPENWDKLNKDQKQKFYDNLRASLSKQYNSNFTQNNSFAASPRQSIMGHPGANVTLDVVNHFKNAPTKGIPEKPTNEEYLKKEFENIFPDDPIVSEFVAKNMVGIIAGESHFNNDVSSSAGAFGIMQLMPANITNNITNPKKYSREDVQLDYVKQVEIAKNLLRDLQKNLSKRYSKVVADQYFDGDEEAAKEYFIGPLIINGYNAGQTILEVPLKDFLQQYPDKKSLFKAYNVEYSDHAGFDTYFFFTQFASKNSKYKNFGPHVRDYVFKWLAFSEAMNSSVPKIDNDYKPYNGSKIKILEAKAETPETKTKTPEISEEDNFISKLSPEEKRALFYAPAISKNIKKYKWRYLSWFFGERGWPTKIQNDVINPWLDAHKDDENLVKSKTKNDFAHLPPLLPKNKRSLQDQLKMGIQLSEVGKHDDGEKFWDQNDPDYIKMHEQWHEVIKELHEVFTDILRNEANLDKDLIPILTITSIGRDDAYVKKANMRNASPNSAHKYGIAFDLRLTLWDNQKADQILFNTKTKQTISLSGQDRIIFELALRQALDKLRVDGKIFINIEWRPPHYHIHIIPSPNTKYVPSDVYFQKHNSYYKEIWDRENPNTKPKTQEKSWLKKLKIWAEKIVWKF